MKFRCQITMSLTPLLWLAVLTLALSSVSGLPRSTNSGGKIIGGRDAEKGEFPYQVSLQRKFYFGNGSRHICGASIIDEYHILTAGHCIYQQFLSQLIVVAGVLNISDTENPERVQIPVVQAYLHEEYDHPFLINDIALVRLKEAFPLNSPVIAAVPLREERLTESFICTASGWGNTRRIPQLYPDILQALDMPLIAPNTCEAIYKNRSDGEILPGMMCAGYMEGKRDACDGDSGGPLQCGGQLTGIVSWGEDCALPGYPGVYTEVSYYKNWIQTHLAQSYQDSKLKLPQFASRMLSQ